MKNKMTFEMADYKYKSNMSDEGRIYKHPVKELSAEFPVFWALRDEIGLIACICKRTGQILADRG